MLENVASYLTDDKDLCRFASICPETYAAVHSNRSGVWRTRFALKYDSPLGKTAPELKKIYTTRCTTLSKQVLFYHGRSSEEQKCLRIIRDLVIGKRFTFLSSYCCSRLVCLYLRSVVVFTFRVLSRQSESIAYFNFTRLTMTYIL